MFLKKSIHIRVVWRCECICSFSTWLYIFLTPSTMKSLQGIFCAISDDSFLFFILTFIFPLPNFIYPIFYIEFITIALLPLKKVDPFVAFVAFNFNQNVNNYYYISLSSFANRCFHYIHIHWIIRNWIEYLQTM